MSKEAAEAIERILPKYGGSVRTELQEAAKITAGLNLKSEENWNSIHVMLPVTVDDRDVGHVLLNVNLDSAMLIAQAQIMLATGKQAFDPPVCVMPTRINPSDANGYYEVSRDEDNQLVNIADVWGGHRQTIEAEEWEKWEVWPDV